MKNEQSTQESTQENKPKRGRPHKQPDEFVFGRRISGTAKFWEALDWLAEDSDKTLSGWLSGIVLDLYTEVNSTGFHPHQLEIANVDKPKPKAMKQPKADHANVLLPFATPEFEKAWAEWVLHRKEKKHALTASTISKQLKKLKKMGEKRAIATIENSILHGYQGLFEATNKATAQPPARRPQTSDHYGI